MEAEEAERRRIAEEKRLAEEMKRREEELKRLDEEQPEVERRLNDMKDKARFAATLRFERDTVSGSCLS